MFLASYYWWRPIIHCQHEFDKISDLTTIFTMVREKQYYDTFLSYLITESICYFFPFLIYIYGTIHRWVVVCRSIGAVGDHAAVGGKLGTSAGGGEVDCCRRSGGNGRLRTDFLRLRALSTGKGGGKYLGS